MSTEPAGLLGALLAFQAEAPTLSKDATNPHFRSKYTPLDTIVETVGPLLVKHGLVWMAKPGQDENGEPVLNYTLGHAPSGEREDGQMPLLLDKSSSQAFGSAITYSRRYSLCAVLNLVADEDDDGNAAGERQVVKRQPQIKDRDAPATDAQKKRINQLLKSTNTKADDARAFYEKVKGEPFPEGRRFADLWSKGEASDVIDRLVQGALPSAARPSDVPSDASGFAHPVGEGDPVPWDAVDAIKAGFNAVEEPAE